MRHAVYLTLLLLALGCEGRLIDPDLPGTTQPPTTNAALAIRLGGTSSEQVADLVTDPAGDLYVTGTFTGATDFDPGPGITALNSLGGSDGFLARYSAAGALVWVARIGGSSADVPTALARDAAGNLYVGGGFSGSSDFDPGAAVQGLISVGGEDGFVAKYSPAGELLWARRFGGLESDEVADVAVDAAGVYATGVFSGQANLSPSGGPTIQSDGSARDGFVLALDPTGVTRWARPLGGPQDDAARALGLTLAGNVVVAGVFRGSADFARNGTPVRLLSQGGADLFVATYSALGVLQWTRGIGGLDEATLPAGGLSLDTQDGAALLGSFAGSVDFDPGAGSAVRNSVGASDLFLARYDAAGNFSAVLTLNGTGSIQGVRVLVDPDGSVLLTGAWSGAIDFDPGAGSQILGSLGQGGATDAFVARYAPAGGLLWVTRFAESTSLPDRANSGTALAVDPSGNVLVGGRFFGTPDFDPGSSALRLTSLGEADVFLVKLTAAGTLATTP